MNIPRTDLTELIGKKFKRNKYGLSIWTDEITFIGYRSKLINRTTKSIEVYVVGSITDQWFDLNEIVIVDFKLHALEEMALQKREIFSRPYTSVTELNDEMEKMHKNIKEKYGNNISTSKPDEGN